MVWQRATLRGLPRRTHRRARLAPRAPDAGVDLRRITTEENRLHRRIARRMRGGGVDLILGELFGLEQRRRVEARYLDQQIRFGDTHRDDFLGNTGLGG